MRRSVRFTYLRGYDYSRLSSASSQGLSFSRKKRERSVAENEGFAEKRHMNDGRGRRHGLDGCNACREESREG